VAINLVDLYRPAKIYALFYWIYYAVFDSAFFLEMIHPFMTCTFFVLLTDSAVLAGWRRQHLGAVAIGSSLNLCSGSSFEAPNASTHQVLSHCLELRSTFLHCG